MNILTKKEFFKVMCRKHNNDKTKAGQKLFHTCLAELQKKMSTIEYNLFYAELVNNSLGLHTQ